MRQQRWFPAPTHGRMSTVAQSPSSRVANSPNTIPANRRTFRTRDTASYRQHINFAELTFYLPCGKSVATFFKSKGPMQQKIWSHMLIQPLPCARDSGSRNSEGHGVQTPGTLTGSQKTYPKTPRVMVMRSTCPVRLGESRSPVDNVVSVTSVCNSREILQPLAPETTTAGTLVEASLQPAQIP